MDYVFFSENLKRYYPKVYNELTEILSKHDVHYGVLKGTADYWCRDYMPVQVDGNSFVQFKYHPDYWKDFAVMKHQQKPPLSWLKRYYQVLQYVFLPL